MWGIWPIPSCGRPANNNYAVPIDRVLRFSRAHGDLRPAVWRALAGSCAARCIVFVLLHVESAHGGGFTAGHNALLFHGAAVGLVARPADGVHARACGRIDTGSVPGVFQTASSSLRIL